jgi:hypothetical protein
MHGNPARVIRSRRNHAETKKAPARIANDEAGGSCPEIWPGAAQIASSLPFGQNIRRSRGLDAGGFNRLSLIRHISARTVQG